jgi:cytochrome c553
LFASLRNPRVPVDTAAAPTAMSQGAADADADADADVASKPAQQAFVRLGCAACHALGGVGNPSLPLDGIASRMDATLIRAWASGSGIAAEELPAGIVRRKARASGDPEFEALIADLATRR